MHLLVHDIMEGDGRMLGHEAMARIRAEVPEKDQPIIFNLTGNVLESDQQMYEGNGSNGVLPKPAKLETLRSRDLRFNRSRLSSPKAHFSRAFHKCRHRLMEPDSLDGEAGASTSIIAHKHVEEDGRLADADGILWIRSSS